MIEDLGRYKILAEIGRGGFATVYRAQDTQLHRLVALKELRATQLHDAGWAKEFMREARTIAHLDHPRIVTIFDVVELAERLFIVMRLVDGAGLDDLIAAQGGLPWAQVVETISAVAEGLDYAHSQGILHRDLKPANILLDSHRGPLLSDFGLAKLVGEASTNVTARGGVVGTPHYIAPEVWEGQGTTPQSDLYALGCILYELITGEKLFGGDSPPAVMMAHFKSLSLPEVWSQQVPAGVGAVLERALARDPEARYTTATEMVNGLFQLSQGHPEAATGTPPQSTPAIIHPPSPRTTHNLPAQTTTFIGRQTELAELHRLLTDSNTRLLTLLGPGGTGKTRLMLQVATEMLDDYEDGVWLVELAPLTDPGLIAERVAMALKVQGQPGRQILDTLAEYLGRKELLLLLDNVEHIVHGSAEIAEHLLEQCPALNILVTGREALFISGETTIQIPCLSLPVSKDNLAPEAIAEAEAVQLFVDRARAVRPDFDLTPQNATMIAEIVQRLDGIPLALELAAARLRMLTVEQIAARLNDRFRLLTGGRRTALPRQQTLRALIDWSWNLLDKKERRLLRRLSVFSGGWSLEAAQAVTRDDQLDEYDIFDNLEQLVNKSLVVAQTLQGDEARYSLLETIRQFGQEELRTAGEWSVVHDRHLQCFLELTEETDTKLRGEYQLQWLNWLDGEYDNIRVALAWAVEGGRQESGRVGAGLRIVTNLYQFWRIRDYVEEGLKWCKQLFAVANDEISPVVRANALSTASVLAGLRGQREVQMRYGEEAVVLSEAAGEAGQQALALALGAQGYAAQKAGDHLTSFTLGLRQIQLLRQAGDSYELGLGLSLKSFTAMSVGKYEEARAMLEEALPLLRETGDSYRVAMALNYRGDLARCEQNYQQAQTAYEESISLLREIGAERDLASVLHNLGHTYLHLGDIESAHTFFKQSMALHQSQQNRPGMAECLIGFAALAAVRDLPAAGARLLAAAIAIGGQGIASEWPATRIEYEHYLSLVRTGLTGAEFQTEQAAGRAFSLEQAVAYAQHLSFQAASDQISRRV